LNYSVLNVVLSLVLGIVCTTYIIVGLNWLVGIVLGLFVILICIHKLAQTAAWVIPIFGYLLSAQFFFIGILLIKVHDPIISPSHYIHHRTPEPQSILFSVTEVLKPSQFQEKYIVKLHQLNSTKTSGRILLNVQPDSLTASLRVGHWYMARSILQELPKPRYPYQFDYGNYLKQQQVYGQISTDAVHILSHQKVSNTPRVWAARFCESTINVLENYKFSSTQLSIIKALILGQRQELDATIKEQYAAAGLMHILAVSGLHVGLVLLLLRLLVSPLKQRQLKIPKSIIIILGVWAFAFITGLSPSVLRAATMFTFLEVGSMNGNRRNTIDAVLASALILLCFDPFLLHQVGFQLSYLAVISILYMQPWLAQFYRPRYFIDRIYWGVATVTIAAQLGVFPLSIYYFHQFPGLFFISNIIVLPFLGIILGLGIFTIALAQLSILPDFLVYTYGKLIDLLNASIGWVAQQESFVFQHLNLSLALMLSLYGFIVFGSYWLHRRNFNRSILALIATLVLVAVLSWEKQHPPSTQLTIFQQSRTTLISIYENNRLHLYRKDSLLDPQKDYRIKAHLDALPIKNVIPQSVPNIIGYKQHKILVIDSSSIYSLPSHTPTYIVLRESPNINLERILCLYPEIAIIADGSNYRSDIERWRKTCLKNKIPFHSTYEKGAYTIY